MNSPAIGWIKRRARRIMTAFNVTRSYAVVSAREDWRLFMGGGRW